MMQQIRDDAPSSIRVNCASVKPVFRSAHIVPVYSCVKNKLKIKKTIARVMNIASTVTMLLLFLHMD